MPAVHIRRDTVRIAERKCELGVNVRVVSSRFVGTRSGGGFLLFCARVKGPETSRDASTSVQ